MYFCFIVLPRRPPARDFDLGGPRSREGLARKGTGLDRPPNGTRFALSLRAFIGLDMKYMKTRKYKARQNSK